MTDHKTDEPRSATEPAHETTRIAAGTIVLGAITTEHDLHVFGRIEGPIDATGAVKLGTTAVVRGNVTGDHVIVAGRVEGTVIAHARLHVLANGSVVGDAQYGSLEVERGGVIDGRSSPITRTATVAIATRAVDGLLSGESNDGHTTASGARAVSGSRALPPPPKAAASPPRASSSLPPPPPPTAASPSILARANGTS